MTAAPETVSVVISTYNRAASLASCLDALTRLDPVPVEVVVVNGPSTDDTEALLEQLAGRIKIARCDQRNLSMSRNIGIAASAGDVVAFIDDDAHPDPGWLVHLLAHFDDPEVGAVGGPTFDHTGAAFQARYSIADRLGEAWVMNEPDAPNPTALLNAPDSRNFIYPIGTNAAFRRELLVDLGGFDEEYEYYLDETDMCRRLVDRGFVIKAADDAFVHHRFLPSFIRTAERAVQDRYPIIKNKAYFALTHGLGTYSFEEVCRSIVDFVDQGRRDVESHVAHGLLTADDRERYERDVHAATTAGFAHWQDGPKLRAPEWFATQREPFLLFPLPNPPAGGRLHVCLLSQEYPPGRVNGIGRLVHALARGLADLGHVVRVLTTGVDHDRVDLEEGVWVHRLVTGEHSAPTDIDVPPHIWNRSATALAELERIEGIRAIDVVQAPNWDSEGIAVIADGRFLTAVGLYTPLATVARMDPGLVGGPDLDRLLAAERYCYEHADALIASGPAVVAEIADAYALDVDDRRVAIVANGLPDDGRPAPAAANGTGPATVLFVGRLEHRKGIDALLRAVPLVLAQCPDVRFVVAGDDSLPSPEGPTHRELFERDASPTVVDAVEFVGRVGDDVVARLYDECDVFVAPSRFESFGLVLLEAMMRGTPVVAGDCPAMAAIVEGGAGLMASADEVPSIAEAIVALVRSPSRRADLGAAGRRRYEERYTSAAMAAGAVDAYRSKLVAPAPTRVDAG